MSGFDRNKFQQRSEMFNFNKRYRTQFQVFVHSIKWVCEHNTFSAYVNNLQVLFWGNTLPAENQCIEIYEFVLNIHQAPYALVTSYKIANHVIEQYTNNVFFKRFVLNKVNILIPLKRCLKLSEKMLPLPDKTLFGFCDGKTEYLCSPKDYTHHYVLNFQSQKRTSKLYVRADDFERFNFELNKYYLISDVGAITNYEDTFYLNETSFLIKCDAEEIANSYSS
ncbi:hypothetical protein EIN_488110 [Entamoeba invadens IP1]|uniref:Uncharacterized protein n=1 Tax=Entamoeba invadens IP1 TaxID=370355 RepID=A0A0A1U519_ENTIV|nr:hypothetical protein EIN_488110 [Entamoeba invadens IP1]ELP89289.1 hypothetical protein EIN_488110 [Entamoeba invadens IP1]|eukprot:XP_004256060.1 hypothetical protein EIN_488110 [Entamoeba invadens IP1]